MGFYFRKSKQIASGVRRNISLSGISYSFGKKGSRVTFRNKRTYFSFKVPFTNIYYRTSTSFKHKRIKTSTKTSSKIDLKKYKSHDYSKQSYNPYYSHQKNNSNNEQWGCVSLIFGIFLFFGFLIGGNPIWAFGSIAIFGFFYWYLTLRKAKNR